MSITLRPYIKDKTRYHVDMQIEHPITQAPLRKRIAAPAGLDERQAQRWGEKELEKWLKTFALRSPETGGQHSPHEARPSEKCELTLEAFYRERFEPNYVRFPASGDPRLDTTVCGATTCRRSGPCRSARSTSMRIDTLKSDLAKKGLEASTDQRRPRQARQDAPLGASAASSSPGCR
jgi:hypothetical protein